MTEVKKVKRLYKFLFREKFPKWVDICIGINGALTSAPTLFCAAPRVEDAIDTLCHEFVHMRHIKWKHDERFFKEVERLIRKVVRY